jgi:hypothetical protein
MVNDWPDAARLSTVLDAVIKTAAQGPVGEYRRVVTCGGVRAYLMGGR